MASETVIGEGDLDFAGAVAGTEAPQEILGALRLILVPYCGFDGRERLGQLVVHGELVTDLEEIFALMRRLRFPLCRVEPIVRFGWSDEASMAADNSSAFNYRTVAGTDRLSRHALGRAVDINPRENPAIYPEGRVAPEGALWRPGRPGVFAPGHPVVRAFRERGWTWGGDFTHLRDYHHFEKAGG
jgi:hypothetical protein